MIASAVPIAHTLPLAYESGSYSGELLGVLDIDSPKVARFTEEDEVGVVRLGEILSRVL